MQERLALLASQHHSSEYSRSKFGANGCPVRYFPLSLHLPDQFNQLRQRQLIDAQSPAWWPSDPVAMPVNLHDEIMAAMSEPLCPSPPRCPSLKTSVSHPINISMMIPPDLVALISSHVLLSSSVDLPTLLEIPPSFTLDRLSNLRDSRIHSNRLAPAPLFSTLTMQAGASHLRTRSHVTDALQAAISSGIDKRANDAPDQVKSSIITAFIPETSVSLSLSMKIPSPMPFRPSPTTQVPDIYHFQPPSRTFQYTPPPTITSIAPPTLATCTAGWTRPHSRFSSQSTATASTFLIGNLFLSSCPGKKVRLDGPVKGRSGVCRDLETDLKRMKELGVGCIVCCLDDNELEFLGAPWPEYEHSAKKIGIDVLRLPIPEGLPPISSPCLDVHLVDLIHRYSLRGIPILVHCRGGVGRAGVIACCWMIRLGLCGWLDPRCATGDTLQDQSTLLFVEKVIALVRRRRSMKAIETYEQVKFLVDYVDHLRRDGLRTLQDDSMSV
ncbi:hypothetical protein GALMADRAFT_249461 [Galerina marginata CBS 339.88]|uniref:Tyrosine specific protein phosphatases domain-containing protein n=1 Tax=Galerina marginata (strain CBS 339.88) TaxID=685588 RepID=A0A067SZC1_GALM3|nr:hypothetical protein GALMADRAFT_249461 [Galerina marginata CBS 339.88]